MPLTQFLLESDGSHALLVGHPAAEAAEPDAAVEAAIIRLDAAARLDHPGTPPPLDPAVAVWAARCVYGLAQALVFRELGAAFIDALQTSCPAQPSPAAAYSADHAFCLLPDLFRLARGISHDDPLTIALARLGAAWPLSSVGMAGIDDADVSSFFGHAALRRLYVDRIIRHGDTGRLRDPAVAAAVCGALGDYRSLAPAIEFALRRPA